MSESATAALLALLAAVVLKTLDAVLPMFFPKDRHWRFIERWTRDDDDDEPDAT